MTRLARERWRFSVVGWIGSGVFKMNRRWMGAITCAILLAFCASVTEAADQREGQLFALVAPYSGKVYGAGFEFEVADTTSLIGNVASFSYKYQDGNYREEGDGRILGVTARFYDAKLMEGLFFGLGIDYISVAIDSGTDIGNIHGLGQSNQFGGAPHMIVGHKSLVGAVSIEPSVRIERLPTDGKVNVILVAGLAVGARF
jgi:hypothetical protein